MQHACKFFKKWIVMMPISLFPCKIYKQIPPICCTFGTFAQVCVNGWRKSKSNCVIPIISTLQRAPIMTRVIRDNYRVVVEAVRWNYTCCVRRWHHQQVLLFHRWLYHWFGFWRWGRQYWWFGDETIFHSKLRTYELWCCSTFVLPLRLVIWHYNCTCHALFTWLVFA